MSTMESKGGHFGRYTFVTSGSKLEKKDVISKIKQCSIICNIPIDGTTNSALYTKIL